jgi:hypothetical protein
MLEKTIKNNLKSVEVTTNQPRKASPLHYVRVYTLFKGKSNQNFLTLKKIKT